MIADSKKIILLIILLSVIAITITYYIKNNDSYTKRIFVSNEWIMGNPKIRGQMVFDLLDNKIKTIHDQNSLLLVLGNPDQQTQDSWIYFVDIGQKMGHSPWIYNLTIYFDKDQIKSVVITD